jgi:hypothetical protein
METTKLTAQEKKRLYVEKNKERIAAYARSYYQKRCEQDENYKKILCENVKKNKKIRNTSTRGRGRPIKYIIIENQ